MFSSVFTRFDCSSVIHAWFALQKKAKVEEISSDSEESDEDSGNESEASALARCFALLGLISDDNRLELLHRTLMLERQLLCLRFGFGDCLQQAAVAVLCARLGLGSLC